MVANSGSISLVVDLLSRLSLEGTFHYRQTRILGLREWSPHHCPNELKRAELGMTWAEIPGRSVDYDL